MTTKIEWCDEVWNPVTGCTKVSAGCRHCYAARFAARHMGEWKSRHFTEVRCYEDRLVTPLHWRKPRRIFVNSMSDLFHEDVPSTFIDSVMAIIALCPQHTFMVLTKRPKRMAAYMRDRNPTEDDSPSSEKIPLAAVTHGGERGLETSEQIVMGGWPLPNLWLGVSVEDQATADERIPLLLQTPAAVRFVSAEPLLGPVDHRSIGKTGRGDDWDALYGWRTTYQYKAMNGSECSIGVHAVNGKPRLDWIVVGGESGPGARPCNVEWIRSIVQQCKAAEVPCFVKQLGSAYADAVNGVAGRHTKIPVEVEIAVRLNDPKGGDMSEWPADLQVRQWPER